MGYHIEILRTSRDGENQISFEEAARAASAIGGWEVTPGSQELSLLVGDQDYLTLWISEGRLWTKNPSDYGLAAMLELAKQLGARVRGDELETYRTVNENYLHPDDAEEKAAAEKEGYELVRRVKRRRLVLHGCIFGTFAVLGLLAKRCDHQANIRPSSIPPYATVAWLTASVRACVHQPNRALQPTPIHRIASARPYGRG